MSRLGELLPHLDMSYLHFRVRLIELLYLRCSERHGHLFFFLSQECSLWLSTHHSSHSCHHSCNQGSGSLTCGSNLTPLPLIYRQVRFSAAEGRAKTPHEQPCQGFLLPDENRCCVHGGRKTAIPLTGECQDFRGWCWTDNWRRGCPPKTPIFRRFHA